MSDTLHRRAAAEFTTPALKAAISEYESDPVLKQGSRLYPFLLEELKKRENGDQVGAAHGSNATPQAR